MTERAWDIRLSVPDHERPHLEREGYEVVGALMSPHGQRFGLMMAREINETEGEEE